MSNRFINITNTVKILSCILLLFFISSCEKEVFTEAEKPASPVNGKIYINSNPAGYTIFLNNKNMGLITPDSLTWLNSGTYKITLRKNLFEDSVFSVDVAGGEKTSLDIDYFKNPKSYGKIICTSIPIGANIFINDSAVNKSTPYTFTNLWPGNYKLKLEYANHRADSSIVTVYGNQIQKFSKTLIDTSAWVNYLTSNSSIPSNYIYCVTHDKDNVIWVGSGNGLIKFTGKKWESYNTTNSIFRSNKVTCLLVDKNNNVWVGTNAGAILYSKGTLRDCSSNLPSGDVTSIVEDKSGNIWIGTYGGLAKYDGSTWTSYTKSNSKIQDNQVLSLAVDSKNRIWTGSYLVGVGVFDGTNWTYYNNSNMGLSESVGMRINAIYIDDADNVWCSNVTSSSGNVSYKATYYNGNSWSIVPLNGYGINSFYQKGNYFLIGTNSGLAFMNGTSISKILSASGMPGIVTANVLLVTVDLNNDLWIANYSGGLIKLKKGNF
jgi:hypothetical protein